MDSSEVEEYIEINAPSATIPISETSTTILHYFDNCDVHFFSHLSNNSGMTFEVNPNHRDPTLVLNKPATFVGVSLDEYTATTLYLVPKIHTSNRIPQVQKSDLEIIIEHTKPGAKERIFVCAIISGIPPNNTNAKIKGVDPGLNDLLQSINTTSSNPTQFRINNSRLLPIPITLTFPGITEGLTYTDSDGNLVVLLTDPLLIKPALLSKLSQQMSGEPPIFSTFDLLPLEVGHINPIRVKFMSNMVPTIPITEENIDKTLDTKEDETTNEPNDPNEDELNQEGVEGMRTKTKNQTTRGEYVYTMQVMSVFVAGMVLGIPVFIWGPELYIFLLAIISGENLPDRSHRLQLATNKSYAVSIAKIVIIGLFMIPVILITIGSSFREWIALLFGCVGAMVLIMFIISIYINMQIPNSYLMTSTDIPPGQFKSFMEKWWLPSSLN